jgi:uncharacterized protein
MKVYMTGGTGFIGSHLISALTGRGDSVIAATRNPDKQKELEGVRYVPFGEGIAEHLAGCDVVVNLAGETLFGKRWTTKVKKRLRDSRIQTTRMLVDAMRSMKNSPGLLLSASGVNYYGDCGTEKITEDRGPGSGFLAELTRDWELAAADAVQLGIRVTTPRISVVLGNDGGALATMLPVFRAFIGGSIGAGTQYFPWIHVDDLCRSFLFAMDNEGISGAWNAAAPKPVTMNEFARELGRTLSRPSLFRVPEFALNMALGEAASLVTTSLRVVPEKIMKEGFDFRYPDIGDALNDLLS